MSAALPHAVLNFGLRYKADRFFLKGTLKRLTLSGRMLQDQFQNIDAMSAASTQGASTAATGPWGAHFEGQVAAFYMMAMLCGAPARGLPGAAIKRVALQQANSGRPLDDVIVHAVDGAGKPAVLEIQVKRTITFADADVVFKKVVGQIVAASRRSDFWTTRYCLAIATARGSSKIDGPIQDVLALAPSSGSGLAFCLSAEFGASARSVKDALARREPR